MENIENISFNNSDKIPRSEYIPNRYTQLNMQT